MIGKRLFDLRKDADLTQDELASALKINKHSISSYERNKSEPPDEIKIAIAQHFNVSVDYLLGLTDDVSPKNTKFPILRLPTNFPKEALPALTEYAHFLIYKAKRDKK